MSTGDQKPTDPDRTLRPDFHTAMAHFYRGEMNRLTVWHVRLDTTTNWAILLTTGMTTFTLGSEKTPHYVLLLGLAVIGMCLLIEARRFQHVHHSACWRLATCAESFWAAPTPLGGRNSFRIWPYRPRPSVGSRPLGSACGATT